MATRKSGALDAMVGARIRMLRIDRGISQTALAARIGISFQQVQRYEQGVGRVGASRLALIASVLDVPVETFFESSHSCPSGSRSPAYKLPVYSLSGPGAQRVLDACRSSPRLRGRIAESVEAIAHQSRGGETTVARLNTGEHAERRRRPSRS